MNENTLPTEIKLLALTEFAKLEIGIGNSELLIPKECSKNQLLLPGCADLQVAQVDRIGYRGDYPSPREWENMLSMLETDQELLWIIAKRPNTGLFYYLGLKTISPFNPYPERTQELRAHFRSLLGQFAKRSFPESRAAECSEDDVIVLINEIGRYSKADVVVTSGFPSPSILEENREFPESGERQNSFGTLNDIIEPFAHEEAFTVVFTVGKTQEKEANDKIAQLTEIKTAISSLIKVQNSISASKAEGHVVGKASGEVFSQNQNETANILSTAFKVLFGSDVTIGNEASADESAAPQKGAFLEKICDLSSWLGEKMPESAKWFDRNLGNRKYWMRSNISFQRGTNTSINEAWNQTLQKGESTTTTTTNAFLELLDQKLQDSLKSLKKAAGTGAYHFGAEVFSPSTALSVRIARNISGCLAGARSYLKPFQTQVYAGEGYADHLTRNEKIQDSYLSITMQSRHVAALFLPVPESDLPGLKTKKNVFYGKPNPQASEKEHEHQNVWLGDLAHLGSGYTARDLNPDRNTAISSEFRIPASDMTSHLLIAGTTGSGKTQRAASILNALPKSRFQVVVIESAKKTYRDLLRRPGVSNRILSLGASDHTALRINPFYFEPGTSLKRHISIFSDALADLLPVEALIGPKLRESIQNCYLKYEWDIEQGIYRGAGQALYPTMLDLHMEALQVAGALNYGPELKSNYKGALLGRTKLFFDDLYQDIFGWGGCKPLKDLFGGDDVIIEMDSLPPSEAKMPSFVLSLLLERIRAHQQATASKGGKDKARDIILVIEEAHNLLDKKLEESKSKSDMGSGGFLLKQIVRLLQEGREAGLGVVVVDQSPASLADAVVRNTNTKIILRITDAEEAERIGTTLGMTKEECRDLHELEDGEAVVKVKNAGKALKLAPAALIDKRPPVLNSPQVCHPPDYYHAGKTLRQIGKRLERTWDENFISWARESIQELLHAAKANPEILRFFGQKLMAMLVESHEFRDLSHHRFPTDSAHLTMLLCKVVKSESMDCFLRQLICLLKNLSWEEASHTFEEADCSSCIPLLSDFLRLDPHWYLFDAVRELDCHLEDAMLISVGQGEREQAYQQALHMVHMSPDRHECLKSFISTLIG